jgi:hypothetical protein
MVLALFGLFGSGALVQADDEPVRLYTNADLERFGEPSPADAHPVVHDDEAAWKFVTDFLEREHGRLDAERAHDLERRRVQTEEQFVDRSRRRSYGVPLGVLGYGLRGGHRSKHFRRNVRGGLPATGGRIVPLHARPSLAQINRAKATRLSGRDAFPNR